MVNVISHELGDMDNFVYIVENQSEAVFVDPAWDAKTLLETVHKRKLNPVGIILTHSHFDHINAIPEIISVYPNLPIYISQAEYSQGRFAIDTPYVKKVKDGDMIDLAGVIFSVIETPGHTIGSLCFYTNKHIFTGDTLFINGIGRCDFHDSDVEAMYDSLAKIKALRLPDSLIVLPGHNYGVTASDTLGNQFLSNLYYLIEDKDFFVDVRLRIQNKFHQIPFQGRTKFEIDKIYQEYKS